MSGLSKTAEKERTEKWQKDDIDKGGGKGAIVCEAHSTNQFQAKVYVEVEDLEADSVKL